MTITLPNFVKSWLNMRDPQIYRFPPQAILKWISPNPFFGPPQKNKIRQTFPNVLVNFSTRKTLMSWLAFLSTPKMP